MSKQDYETPQELFDKLDKEFKFTIDVCANSMNNKITPFYDKYDDGLIKPWFNDICWLNPPFGETKKWLKKAYEEMKRGSVVVALIQNDCSTNYWKDYVMKASEIRFVNQRVKFDGSPPRFSNVIVIFKRHFRRYPKVRLFTYKEKKSC